MPERSKAIDESVFSSVVGTRKRARGVFEPSLRSGIVELWPWGVRHQVRRMRKSFIGWWF